MRSGYLGGVPSATTDGWVSALWALGATVAFAGAWYLAAVRGSTEEAFWFAWMAGSLVALVGLIVTAVLIARAFSRGTRLTPFRVAIAAAVCVSIAGLILGIRYVGG